MGQRRTIELKLTAGIDQRIAKKILPGPLLDEVNNSVFTAEGRIVRRRGWYTGSAHSFLGRGIFALEGALAMLTSQYLRHIGPNGTTWLVGPYSVVEHTTPVKSHQVPPSPWAALDDYERAQNVRRGVLSCECAAIPCDETGTIRGSYVLVASLSDVAESTGSDFSEWGYVQLHGYHVWEDDYGQVHWDCIWRHTDTTNYAHQLRVWRCGPHLFAGFFVNDTDNAAAPWGHNTICWKPRTSASTYTTSALMTHAVVDFAPSFWDVHTAETEQDGKTEYCVAANFGTESGAVGGLYVWVVDEDMTTKHSAHPGGVTNALVAVLWDSFTEDETDYAWIHVATKSGTAIYDRVYDTSLTLQTTTTLKTPVSFTPKTLALSNVSGYVRAWYGNVTADVDCGLNREELYWVDEDRATFAVSTSGMVWAPGRMVSKPFSWRGVECAWVMTSCEDDADRSYACVALHASATTDVQGEPIAVVSPNQAAEIRATGSLSMVSDVTTEDDMPPRWFWCAPETYAGNSAISEPDMAPQVHTWGLYAMLPDSPVVDGRQVFAPMGLPLVWGHSGPIELQPIRGPGKIATVDNEYAVTGLPAGDYTYRAIYRIVRPDGSVVRSKPSEPSTVTVTESGSPGGSAQVWVRNPRISAVPDGVLSDSQLFADVYRTEVDTGTIFYFVGSLAIPAAGNHPTYYLIDCLPDATLITREALYTHQTNGIPSCTVPSFSTLRMHGGRLFGAHGRRLWYSTQRAANDGPYFPAGAYLDMEDEITALGSTEAGLVVFTRSSTWLLYGDGPGPSLQPFWASPNLIARDIGCVSQCSVHEWRDGLIFQSDRGLAVLRKTGQIEHFSEPVRDWMDDYPVVRRVVEDGDTLRFLAAQASAWPGDPASGATAVWLVWNTLLDHWTTETADGVGEFDACLVHGADADETALYAMTRIESSGYCYVWSRNDGAGVSDRWSDTSTTAVKSYPTRTLKTGTIRPAGVGGYGRLRRIRLYGEPPAYDSAVTGEQVTITVVQDCEANSDVHSHHVVQVLKPLYGATAEQVVIEIAPMNQKCSEFYLTLEQTEPSLTGSLYVQALLCSTTNVDLSVTGVGTTVNGVVVALNDRVLMAAQTLPVQNGVYRATAGAWARVTDYAAGISAEALAVNVTAGTNAGPWVCTSSPSVVGTNNLVYVQSFGGGEGTAWTALAFDWEDLAGRPRTATTLRA